MQLTMTIFTQSYNFQPILAGIRSMMIFFCLLSTFAQMNVCWRQSSISNGIINSSTCYVSIMMICMFSLCAKFPVCRFFVLCIAIATAGFAPTAKTVVAASVLTKFRQWFRGLAFRAGLCYDAVSHFNLPKRLLWLEPVLAGYIPAPGSFYYSRAWRQVK